MFSALGSPNDLARMGKIPTKLSATYMELVAAKPEKRPTSRYVLFDSMIKGCWRLNFEILTSKKILKQKILLPTFEILGSPLSIKPLQRYELFLVSILAVQPPTLEEKNSYLCSGFTYKGLPYIVEVKSSIFSFLRSKSLNSTSNVL